MRLGATTRRQVKGSYHHTIYIDHPSWRYRQVLSHLTPSPYLEMVQVNTSSPPSLSPPGD